MLCSRNCLKNVVVFGLIAALTPGLWARPLPQEPTVTPPTATAQGDLIWFANQDEFEAFVASQGKAVKGVEDFEESIMGPANITAFDDPLESNVPNSPDGFPFPVGMTGLPNLVIQSNLLGGNPSVPDPSGASGLAAVSAGFLGAVSDVVTTNHITDSFDLIFTSAKSGVGFNPISFMGAKAVEIRVYSTTNVFLGETPSPADPSGASFIGVWSSTTIGRINLFDPDDGFEGADRIQTWQLGPFCGAPDAGSCFEEHPTPFCDDVECCTMVCAIDPFCCDTQWDGQCVDEAQVLCAGCGDPDAGSCFANNGTPGCDDAECCALVCDADPFCCEFSWDQLCADGAAELCGLPPENDLCDNAIPVPVFSSVVGKTNDATIDDEFPFCGTSITAPGLWYSVIGTGNTMTATTCSRLTEYNTKISVYCNTCADPTCVGGNDDDCGDFSPLFSTVTWCSQEGVEYLILVHGSGSETGSFELVVFDDGVECDNPVDCTGGAGCGDADAGSCFEANGTPACDDAECCEIVCAIDPFCCDNNWDSICVDEAQELCAGCGNPDAGSCFENNGTPGCDDAECCATVCDADPFCCEFSWDQLCADEAAELCGGGGGDVYPNDFNAFRGFHNSGTLDDVLASDDVDLCHDLGITIFPSEAPITLDFDGTLSTDSPASLDVTFESSANTPGLELTISFWNYNTNSWDPVGTAAQGFNVDVVRTFAGDPANHVEAGTGEVRTRYEVRVVSFIFLFPWTDCVDQVYWNTCN